MIARFVVLLPFTIIVAKNEQFLVYQYSDSGYKIQIFPPLTIDQQKADEKKEKYVVDQEGAIETNGLRIDFVRKRFNRKEGMICDPSYDFIAKTVNSFLLKLRFITRSTKIHIIDLRRISWKLRYLNDDGTEIKKRKGYVRGRGTKAVHFSWTALNKEIWNDIFKLPLEYIPPQWNEILLDAKEALPGVGQSIVLAAIALEVFISQILNQLAPNSAIPEELWNWINKRGFWLKDPSTREQFDILLKVLLGVSLKQDNKLWEAFGNLRDARNSFVHDGIAKVGKNIVSKDDASKLVNQAEQIIKFVRNKLPQEFQWPQYQHSIKVSVTKKLF